MSAEAPQLGPLVAQHNRRVLGEAIIALGVGLVSCLVVFGGIYWLSFLAFYMCFHGFAFGGPAVASAVVAGVFLLVSVWSAWRRVDPIAEADIAIDDSGRREFENMLGLSLGIPIIRRDNLASGAALLIGGPASVLDAFSLWRDRLPAGAALIRDAEHALVACRNGLASEAVRNPKVVALLYRLKLIKAVAQLGGKVKLELTQKGMEVLGSASRK